MCVDGSGEKINAVVEETLEYLAARYDFFGDCDCCSVCGVFAL